jgi:hypothetical protein
MRLQQMAMGLDAYAQAFLSPHAGQDSPWMVLLLSLVLLVQYWEAFRASLTFSSNDMPCYPFLLLPVAWSAALSVAQKTVYGGVSVKRVYLLPG